ncbi:hypothetical protein K450DRAFT_238186 [Umbelopsis ramanniana AG]|uniref:WW domain-containing protein n=1 Tax=Umbelopsis ramanniana AG TaxID=1314678 RepID=A0AAD5ECE6_UMBRA|nr:uncharacterized protein K450DRAFT_238186 [Umbelopsis ramanniana AG]KAI8580370.1 hypothetical protein K450DRAFT_238186 [Umbelopsis ramanniana AG]
MADLKAAAIAGNKSALEKPQAGDSVDNDTHYSSNGNEASQLDDANKQEAETTDIPQGSRSVESEDEESDDAEAQNNAEEPVLTAETADQPPEEQSWVPTWDEESQAYYWWNTVTNETTWDNPYPDLAQDQAPEDGNAEGYYEENQGYYYPGYADSYPTESNPLDAVLNKIDTEVRTQLDNTTETSRPFQSYNELFDPSEATSQAAMDSYNSVAHFNSRTGKFTSSKEADTYNPDYMSLESRAKRQMQFYFDVDAYQEQINRERLANPAGKKRPLTKQEVEKFKRQKQEKKEKRKRDWLSKDHD